MEARKKKFGVVSQADKIAQRKERFDTGTSAASNPAGINMSEDALAKRRARFGVTQTEPPFAGSTLPHFQYFQYSMKRPEILTESKKRKRMERFGITDDGERLAKRVKRFGSSLSVTEEVKNPAFADKIAKRRAKFGIDDEAKLK